MIRLRLQLGEASRLTLRGAIIRAVALERGVSQVDAAALVEVGDIDVDGHTDLDKVLTEALDLTDTATEVLISLDIDIAETDTNALATRLNDAPSGLSSVLGPVLPNAFGPREQAELAAALESAERIGEDVAGRLACIGDRSAVLNALQDAAPTARGTRRPMTPDPLHSFDPDALVHRDDAMGNAGTPLGIEELRLTMK